MAKVFEAMGVMDAVDDAVVDVVEAALDGAEETARKHEKEEEKEENVRPSPVAAEEDMDTVRCEKGPGGEPVTTSLRIPPSRPPDPPPAEIEVGTLDEEVSWLNARMAEMKQNLALISPSAIPAAATTVDAELKGEEQRGEEVEEVDDEVGCVGCPRRRPAGPPPRDAVES